MEIGWVRYAGIEYLVYSAVSGYSMGMGRGNNNIYSDCTLSLAPVRVLQGGPYISEDPMIGRENIGKH